VVNILKKQFITQIKRLHYPIWVIYPQVRNQCYNRTTEFLYHHDGMTISWGAETRSCPGSEQGRTRHMCISVRQRIMNALLASPSNCAL